MLELGPQLRIPDGENNSVIPIIGGISTTSLPLQGFWFEAPGTGEQEVGEQWVIPPEFVELYWNVKTVRITGEFSAGNANFSFSEIVRVGTDTRVDFINPGFSGVTGEGNTPDRLLVGEYSRTALFYNEETGNPGAQTSIRLFFALDLPFIFNDGNDWRFGIFSGLTVSLSDGTTRTLRNASTGVNQSTEIELFGSGASGRTVYPLNNSIFTKAVLTVEAESYH